MLGGRGVAALAAANSQEAMLRAEQALDRARDQWPRRFCGLCGFPQRETARLRQMGIADEIVQALKENRHAPGLSAHHRRRSRKPIHYECLLRMIRPDGQVMTAGYFVPAAEQMGIVHLVDRFALETAMGVLKRASGADPGGQCLGHRGVRSRLAAGLCRPCRETMARWRTGWWWN